MNIEKLEKRNAEKGRKSSSKLFIDRYEYPQEALKLVAHICTNAQKVNLDKCTRSFYKKLDEMRDSFEEENLMFANKDFIEHCKEVMADIENRDVQMTLTIGVAGAFSSGKSSLLNALTKLGDALPTGIDPVSIVNTAINCNPNVTQMEVRGRNIRNEVVLLDKEVLGCIKHTSKTKVFFTSVLNKLILDIPAPDYLSNICFIDTPGYNNSDKKNIENGMTDKDTALSAIKSADAILWCIDIKRGTICDSDLQLLREINLPYIIIFTKKDQVPESEVVRIMKEAYKQCKNGLSHEPVAIVAFEKRSNELLSLNGTTDFSQCLQQLKEKCGVHNFSESCKKRIGQLFDIELKISQEAQRDKEEYRKYLRERLRTQQNEQLEDENEKLTKEIQIEKKFQKLISQNRPTILQEVEVACDECHEEVNSILNQLQPIENIEDKDIFSAIAADNMERFLKCISSGVDMSAIGHNNYTPMTAAVASGNNEMVKFFIEKAGKDILRKKDGNGYNAFETAVINHYKDICDLLLQADSQIPSVSRPVAELSQMNKFKQWIITKTTNYESK